MNIKYLLPIIALSLLCACGGSKSNDSTESTTERDFAKGQSTVQDEVSDPNILLIAAGSESHTTLVAAIQAAGLEDVLANSGPFTVFAPTNEAFEALPEGTVANLLKPENKSQLVKIIYYHAAPGVYAGDDLKDGMLIDQATNQKVEIKKSGDQVTVNDAKILATVEASNGVIHVIDQVLLPPQ